MKIFSRRRKLIWFRDLICCKSKRIFSRKQYKSENEEQEREQGAGGGGGGGREAEEVGTGAEQEQQGGGGEEAEEVRTGAEQEQQGGGGGEEAEEVGTGAEQEQEGGGGEAEEAGTGAEQEQEEEEEGGGGGKDRCFKELPDDVMQLILHRLPLSDYLNCRDVSPCWRAAIDSKRWLPPAHQLPWLLHGSSHSKTYMKTFYIKTDYDYLFVSDRKICTSKNNRTDNLWNCFGSIEGWLIMGTRRTNAKSFFFLNPVSGAQVMLPSHSAPEIFNCFPKVKLVASSVPTTTKLQPQQRSCYVACLHLPENGRLTFCTPTDKSWTFIEAEKALQFFDIEIVDGKLYAVGSHVLELVMVIDIHLDSHDNRLHTYTSKMLVTLHPNVKSIIDTGIYHRNCYLAKCSESKELFMILYQGPIYGKTEGFQVLRLEYYGTTSPQWVEIVDLGDRAIFLGGISSKIVTSHDKTVERKLRNCIYFVYDGVWTTYESRVFSLTNRSIKPLTFPKHHCRGQLNETLWFTPNPW